MIDSADAPTTPKEKEGKTGQRVFTGRLFRIRRGCGKGFTEVVPEELVPEPERPFAVARMLALAHKMQGMIDSGEVPNRATLARNLGFSRARISQLFDLLLLAPDLQEQILLMEVAEGRDPITERELRKVVRYLSWSEQRVFWDGMWG